MIGDLVFNKCESCGKIRLMISKDSQICGECHAKLIMMGCNAILTDNMETSKIFISLNDQGIEKMKNKQLLDSLVNVARDVPYTLPTVKTPTNIVRKEYPYFKRVLNALLGKPTYYEVNEWISPVFNDNTKGDEIKVKINVISKDATYGEIDELLMR